MSSLQSFPHNQINQSLAQHPTSTANHMASHPHSHAIDSSQSLPTEQDIDPHNALGGPNDFDSDHDASRYTEQNDVYSPNGLQNRQFNTSTRPTERCSISSHQQQLSNASPNTTATNFGKHLGQTSLPGAQLPNRPTIQEQDTLVEENETSQALGGAAGLVTRAAETTTPAGSTKQRPMSKQAWCPIDFDRCKKCKLINLINSHLHTHREGDPMAVRHACSLCNRSPFNSFEHYMAHMKAHISKTCDVDYDGGYISGDEFVTNMHNMARGFTQQLQTLLKCEDLTGPWKKVRHTHGWPRDLLWIPNDHELSLRDELCRVPCEDKQTMERIMTDLIKTLHATPVPASAQPQVNGRLDVSQPIPSTFQRQNATPMQLPNGLLQGIQQFLDTESSQPYPPTVLAQPYSTSADDYAADPSTDVHQQPSPPYATEAHRGIYAQFEVAHSLQYSAWWLPAHSQDLKPWPTRVSSLQHLESGSWKQDQAPSGDFAGGASQQQLQVPCMTRPPVRGDNVRPRSSKSSHRDPSHIRRPRHE